MKGFTRREVLWRLAAAPALGMFSSLARAISARQRKPAESPFQRVNVFFHGLSVIEFSADEVHVYLPDIGGDRAYLAGSWMQEVALRHGTEYRLSGVMTGPRPQLGSIEPERNAIFHNRKIDSSLSFCKLVFPFPDFLTPLRPLRKKHGKHFFTGTPAPIIEPKTLPQVTAFTYVHPDLTSILECRPLAWTPVVQGGTVNLHIWDSPVKTPSPQASRQAFERMAKMIGAPKLQINPVYEKIKPPRPEQSPVVEGMACQEEWTLIERLSKPESCGKHRKYHPKDDSGIDNLSIILY